MYGQDTQDGCSLALCTSLVNQSLLHLLHLLPTHVNVLAQLVIVLILRPEWLYLLVY